MSGADSMSPSSSSPAYARSNSSRYPANRTVTSSICFACPRPVSMSCNLLEFGKDLRLALSVDHDFHRQERIVAACLQSRQRDGLLDPSRHQDLKDRTVVCSSKYYIWPQPSSPQTLICQTVLVRRYVFAAQEDAVARAWIEMWPVIAPEVLVLCL